MRFETVEEYLARGGKIKKFPRNLSIYDLCLAPKMGNSYHPWLRMKSLRFSDTGEWRPHVISYHHQCGVCYKSMASKHGMRNAMARWVKKNNGQEIIAKVVCSKACADVWEGYLAEARGPAREEKPCEDS